MSAVSSIVEEVLDGFSCTIFAYGQTGTGKTYTMTGDLSTEQAQLSVSAGVIPRAIHQIFNYLEVGGWVGVDRPAGCVTPVVAPAVPLDQQLPVCSL